jgi:hypothetical protein
MGYTPMRYMLMRYTLMRCMPMFYEEGIEPEVMDAAPELG